MGIKSFKPTTPSRREMTVADFKEITAKKTSFNLNSLFSIGSDQ